ncbi:MAG: hypothetical protein ACRD27_11610 [Terracidiphilus sp.]
MNIKNQFGSLPDAEDQRTGLNAALNEAGDSTEQDPLVEQALRNFKASVLAWSEASYSRPRAVETANRARSWRRAASWAMACVLFAGGVSGGVFEHVRQQRAAEQIAAQAQRARQEQLAAAERRAQARNQKLMATVDTDISQEVPSAMEPLADLMENGGTE